MSSGQVVTHGVDERLAQERPLIERICARLIHEVGRHDLPALDIDPARAAYSLRDDPYTGEAALIGQWPADAAGRKGNLIINADGSFFAEYDVLTNDPANPRQFVEATTVWGRGERLGAELRLLEWPE
ncbi:hypothetical protein [Zoogloea sp. LCSB751]|uniref:hypothetical protein n=1 Tax=Zoogloea sp. LCSB751 TaxID=1965277 RepID=UPI0009A4A666|nr:hypothetical protein [Zoogloea sp. LCSB751]